MSQSDLPWVQVKLGWKNRSFADYGSKWTGVIQFGSYIGSTEVDGELNHFYIKKETQVIIYIICEYLILKQNNPCWCRLVALCEKNPWSSCSTQCSQPHDIEVLLKHWHPLPPPFVSLAWSSEPCEGSMTRVSNVQTVCIIFQHHKSLFAVCQKTPTHHEVVTLSTKFHFFPSLTLNHICLTAHFVLNFIVKVDCDFS